MKVTPQQVLAAPMRANDAKANTVRDYLVALLTTLFDEGEGFSGKRPFGNSGWEWDLLAPLVEAGFIAGVIDEDGYLDSLPGDSEAQGNELIFAAIKALGAVTP